MFRRTVFTVAALAVAVLTLTTAQQRLALVKSVRLYVFENGSIRGLDPKLFNFTREELKEVDFTSGGAPVTEGIMTASKPLLPQLASASYTPLDITYFALSHFHSDHTANANAFAKATWIVQKAERDFMFSDTPQGIIQPAQYSALKNAKTKLLNDEDFDVFGDGTVVVKSAPGHTPGHQVLFVTAEEGTRTACR